MTRDLRKDYDFRFKNPFKISKVESSFFDKVMSLVLILILIIFSAFVGVGLVFAFYAITHPMSVSPPGWRVFGTVIAVLIFTLMILVQLLLFLSAKMVLEMNFYEIELAPPGMKRAWYFIMGTKVNIPRTCQLKYLHDVEEALSTMDKSQYFIQYDPPEKEYHVAVTFRKKADALMFKMTHF